MNSPNPAMSVAILGTGSMGVGMAHSLLRQGFQVRAWNRTIAKAQPLAADGASVSETAADAIAGADVVISILYDTDSVLDVVSEAAPAFGADTVWLQSATIGVDGAARVAGLAADRGLTLLDAPVLGTKGPAEQGKLVSLVSGEPALLAKVQPVLDAISTRTVWAGDELGKASALKLACNAWIATLNAAAGQSLALAGSLGLEPALFLEALAGGMSDSMMAQVKGKQMLAGDFTTSFALDGVVKDVGLMKAAAESVGMDITMLSAVGSTYAKASAAGHGSEDMSSVYHSFLPG